MAISFRRECYSKWTPPEKENETETSDENASESGKTIKKGLMCVFMTMKCISQVNVKAIEEFKKRMNYESDEESESDSECGASNTCTCIKVYVTRRNTKGVENRGGKFQRKQQNPNPERSWKLLALRTKRTVAQRSEKTRIFRTFERLNYPD